MQTLTINAVLVLVGLGLLVLGIFITNIFVIKEGRNILHNKELAFWEKILWFSIILIPILGIVAYKIYFKFFKKDAEEITVETKLNSKEPEI